MANIGYNRYYRADCRVFSHNTEVATLLPQTTALLHLGAGDGVTNRPRLLRLVVQRKGHVRRDFGYQSQSGIVGRSHQRMRALINRITTELYPNQRQATDLR